MSPVHSRPSRASMGAPASRSTPAVSRCPAAQALRKADCTAVGRGGGCCARNSRSVATCPPHAAASSAVSSTRVRNGSAAPLSSPS
eukprot:scaffold11815_cov146-Isochrysis_galbana.AAC.2